MTVDLRLSFCEEGITSLTEVQCGAQFLHLVLCTIYFLCVRRPFGSMDEKGRTRKCLVSLGTMNFYGIVSPDAQTKVPAADIRLMDATNKFKEAYIREFSCAASCLVRLGSGGIVAVVVDSSLLAETQHRLP